MIEESTKVMRKSVLALILVVVMLGFTACGTPKTPLTTDQFSEQAASAGYEVSDATEQLETESVQEAAVAENGNYQLWFYTLPSSSAANAAFAGSRQKFEDAAGGFSSYKSVTILNYKYYYQTASNNFYLVAVIDNTMVYCVAEKSYANEIKDFVKSLGYM